MKKPYVFKDRKCQLCDTVFTPINPNNKYCSLICAFWDKVTIGSPTDCWNWKGAKSKKGGYGILRRHGTKYTAHKLSWVLYNGHIPKIKNSYHGLCILHKCDNPSCCNPKHLFLGTQATNIKDMINKNRRRDYSGENNPAAVLTKKQVLQIRKALSKGTKMTTLMHQYNISRSSMRRIKYFKTWKHI